MEVVIIKKYLYCKYYNGDKRNGIHECTNNKRLMLHKNKGVYELKQPSKIKKLIHKVVPYKNCVLGNFDKMECCKLYKDKFIFPV